MLNFYNWRNVGFKLFSRKVRVSLNQNGWQLFYSVCANNKCPAKACKSSDWPMSPLVALDTKVLL